MLSLVYNNIECLLTINSKGGVFYIYVSWKRNSRLVQIWSQQPPSDCLYAKKYFCTSRTNNWTGSAWRWVDFTRLEFIYFLLCKIFGFCIIDCTLYYYLIACQVKIILYLTLISLWYSFWIAQIKILIANTDMLIE